MLAVVLACALTGCAQYVPETGDYLQDIPAALLASNIGVTDVVVWKTTSGQQTSVGVAVDITLDDETFTAADLEEALVIIGPLIDQPGARFLDYAVYGPGGLVSGNLIDLEPVIEELNERWLELDPNAERFIPYYAPLRDVAAFVNLVQ